MDTKRIFLKDACPTSVGGQAVIEGIMMKGEKAASTAIRLPNGDIHIKTSKLNKRPKLAKIPLVRGVIVFFLSLIEGMKTLMYAADVLEAYDGPGAQDEEYKPSKFENWLEKTFGEQGVWSFMIGISLILSIVFTVVVFIIVPTAAVSFLKHLTTNTIILNLVEGVLRIIIFVLYIYFISKMEDIKRVFQYHGAEHKTIHCFENGEELTPENCKKYYTLHPRCGTSFLMFVMLISLIVFSFLGWPNLGLRIASRVILMPLIAGISFEALKLAGRSDNWLVRLLSMPGIYLQLLTTKEPEEDQLEVAIAAMEAVLKEEPEYGEGISDSKGNIVAENIYIRKRK